MGSRNRVDLIGYLGRDAELRYTQGGLAVASLSVATSERWKDKEGALKERTEWHRVTAWGKLAEFAGKLQKGKQVAIEGRLETRKWEKDGEARYTTEVVAQSVMALGPRDGERVVRGDSQDTPEDDAATDNIPF